MLSSILTLFPYQMFGFRISSQLNGTFKITSCFETPSLSTWRKRDGGMGGKKPPNSERFSFLQAKIVVKSVSTTCQCAISIDKNKRARENISVVKF